MLGGISETIPMEQFCFSFFGLPGLKLMHSCPIPGVFGVLNQLSSWDNGMMDISSMRCLEILYGPGDEG